MKRRQLAAMLLVSGASSPALAQTYTMNTVATFTGANGANPEAGLIFDSSGDLYGTTEYGGTNGAGTVFEVVSGTINDVVTFNGANGSGPQGELISDGSGNIYGTASGGGSGSSGVVFEISGGVANTIATFTGTNGNGPIGNMVFDSSNNLYGVTNAGGTNGLGAVFQVGAGAGRPLSTLASFSSTGGYQPSAGPIADSGVNLYGTTSGGGANSAGTIFEVVNGSGTPTTVASFNGTTNGASPLGGLVADSHGNLYGTAFLGGANSDGCVFEESGGTITPLASFNGANGQYPSGNLIMDAQGNLFGTTQAGGANGDGAVFEVVAGSNAITLLASFNGTNGETPDAGLLADNSGDLFGTTFSGGADGNGVIFELSLQYVWAATGGGNWPTTADWNPAGVPATGGTAYFEGSITSAAIIDLNGAKSVAGIVFNNANDSYTLAAGSGGSLTLSSGSGPAIIDDIAGNHFISAPVTLSSNTDVTVATVGNTLQISGSITGSGALVMSGAGTLQLSNSNSYSGGTTVSSGTLLASANNALPTGGAVVNNGILNVNGANTTGPITGSGSLTVGTGVSNNTLQLAINSPQSSQSSISVAAGSTLDITNDSVIINFTGIDPAAAYQTLVNNGDHGGAWTGTTSITSSTVAAADAAAGSFKYGVALADGGDGSSNTSLTSHQLELTAALAGDCNLDGKVDSTDLGIVLGDFGKTGQDWDEGSFNGSGTVDSTNLGLLLGNFGQTASLSVTQLDEIESLTGDLVTANADGAGYQLVSVPEPASLGLLTMVAAGVLSRRRRR